jgi:hypothetical protein
MSRQKLPQQMIGIAVVLLLLVGCGAPAAIPLPPKLAPPTATPLPPKPGATLVGTITMDRAKSAQITLKVSDDGQTIERVSASFTELKCEGFSAGSSSTTATGRAPITDGKFEFKSSNLGEISGQFTSPSAVQGAVHLVFVSGKAECGTWPWSATGN